MTVSRVVIVGGGLAGAKTAEALRAQGFVGEVTLIAQEAHVPYERPGLSKGFMLGEQVFSELAVHPRQWYSQNRIDLREGVHANRVDAAGKRVILDDGSAAEYDRLVLATGSVPRRLPIPGAAARNVFTLRNVEDAEAIRATFGPGRNLVFVGGGWIGLEVAAAAVLAGSSVTVIERGSLPLVGILGPEMAQVFADLHRSHGVDLRLDAQLSELVVQDGAVIAVELADGSRIPADAVIMGVGALPAVELAESAGLAVDNGVLVDSTLRSSNPDIYAVGDIANHNHPLLGRRIRVEHWATALNQPAAAVASLLGAPTDYDDLPYFYSDQYDLGMEYLGSAPAGSFDRVLVRGDLSGREFVAFWVDDQSVIKAVMTVNTWDVIDQVKPWIVQGLPVDPQKLVTPGVPYPELGVS